MLGATFGSGKLPSAFLHEITYNGETVEIEFSKFSNRGPLFEVLEQQIDGSLYPLKPGESRVYIGHASAHPGAVAAGILREDGSVLARLTFESGVQWVDVSGEVFSQGVAEASGLPTISRPPTMQVTTQAGADLYAADILIDLPKAHIIASGGTAAGALEMAEYSMMCLNTVYIRDAGIIHRIGRVIIRMNEISDPYKHASTAKQLLKDTSIRSSRYLRTWNSGIDHDFVLIAFSRISDDWLSKADWNGDFSEAARHELSYSWSLYGKYRSLLGKTMNSGNKLTKMSCFEVEKVLTRRSEKAEKYLVNLGNVAPAVPPRAGDDVVFFEIGADSASIPVLSNDNDINDTALKIKSVTTSKFGISPTIKENHIEIALPNNIIDGNDVFSYVIEDAEGQTDSASVYVVPYMEGDTLGHWTFNQNDIWAIDSSSRKRTGRLIGDASIRDDALILDGKGDYVELPGLGVSSNQITYCAMVYHEGQGFDLSTIISTSNRDAFFWGIDSDNKLTYRWDKLDGQSQSSLEIPEAKWTFVAQVVEPDQVTFYMDDGTGMQRSRRMARHSVKNHSQEYRIGHSALPRSFWGGMIDEVRVINRALTDAEISALAAKGLGASDPSPANGDRVYAGTFNRLLWKPSALSTENRLYFSNDYLTTRDAQVGDPSDRGVVLQASADLSDIPEGYYYWRVDSKERDGSIIKGNIWSFEMNPSGLVAHWPLAGLTGAIVKDVANNFDGTLYSGLYGGKDMPGPFDQSAADEAFYNFHAIENIYDYVEVPYHVETNPETFTISAWARVDGYSGRYRTVLSSRSMSPYSGYSIYVRKQDDWSFRVGDGIDTMAISTLEPIVDGQWYHLVGVYDGENIEFYVNGELKGIRPFQVLPNARHPLRIGSGTPETRADLPFRGGIRNVRIWNRALNLEEIDNLFKDTTVPSSD